MTAWRIGLATVRALVRKDLRLLRPMLLGLLGLHVAVIIVQGVLSSPDRAMLVSLETGASDGTEDVIEGLLVALLAALVLLPGERDARTDQLVAMLPVRPKTVLASKFAVIAAVVTAHLWAGILIDWGLALCNPESFSQRQLTGSGLLLALGLATALAFVTAAHSLWLSFAGRFAWVIFTLGLVAAALLVAYQPGVARFGPDTLVELQHHGTTPLFPWSALLVNGAIAFLALWVGTSLWLRERKPPSVAQLGQGRGPGKSRRLLTLAAGGLGFMGLLALAAHFYWGPHLQTPPASEATAEGDGDGEGGESGNDDDGQPAQEQGAGRFVFTYRPGDAEKMRQLASDAEDAYSRIRGWLGAPAIERIVVDLTYQGVELGGVTLGSRVNVDISREQSREELREVMAHELVHVFQHTLARQARPEQENQLRFITEGLAEHVVFELYGDPARRAEARSRSAWARKRYRIRLADLFQPDRFLARFDERWLYDFGERWVASLVAICGRAEAALLFRRLAEVDLPKSLAGADLVRHVLQRDRCSFDRVESHYEDQFAAGPSPRAALEALPTVRARFKGRADQNFSFDVTVTAPDTDPRQVVLVLRNNPATSPRNYATRQQDVPPGQLTRVVTSAAGLAGPRFQYRVGVRPRDNASPLFSRWRWSSIERLGGATALH